MLRFKVLVSAVPLIAAAVIAKIELAPSPQPCIAVGADTLALGSAPFHADLHVDFTDDPALATVRVALADDPGTADFVVVDDAPVTEARDCGMTAATDAVGLTADPLASAPLIYLARDKAGDGTADYRIYVRSSRLTARNHAASPANPLL
ncbi:signal peptide [Bradyrhizobium oligotrophicum S58]|uniref:Signal peptide n=1 Tax=Bradyrhizobium oligotrophicum S58 TaxID=1245469 RepID=M4ZJ05_9BRAD|nr:hypothetical protein [Bradyrhizobium oligotrophicum]BAM86250.1 signal peptide [Bradyrhizobium oligotrophicum S58]